MHIFKSKPAALVDITRPLKTPLRAGHLVTVRDEQHGDIRLRVTPLNAEALLILYSSARQMAGSLPWPKKLVNEKGQVLWSTTAGLNTKTLLKAKTLFLLQEIV